ncbi:MAG: glycosyltransferase [Bacteroidota bacterium]
MKFGAHPLDLVIIGRSILSSYENPTAELYRGLINELAQHGHRTTFLELQPPGERRVRDMLRSPYCQVWTYRDTASLMNEYTLAVQSADVVMLGSGVEDAEDIAIWIAEEARGIKVYYDSNLHRTLRSLQQAKKEGDCLSCRTIVHFNLFLSTTGGPTLQHLAEDNDLAFARPLYESVDPYSFYRTDTEKTYDLGFIGNYKADRMDYLRNLLLEPAGYAPNRQFALAGSGYDQTDWPGNLTYLEYLPETNLVDFYNRQRCTLVVPRADRRTMGYTPTRRLLAAAACGVPVLTDSWDGLDYFLEPNREVFCVSDRDAVLKILYHTEESQRIKLGTEARKRILAQHTIAHRAEQFLGYLAEVTD